MRPLVLVPVLVVALICGTIVGSLILPLGLVLHEFIVWPLAFGIGALFAAIGAGWVGTLLASDHTRSRLLSVVGVSEAMAAVVAVIGLALRHLLRLEVPLLGSMVLSGTMLFGLGMVPVALGASWATQRFRSSGRHRLGKDVGITVGLLALAALALVGATLSPSLFACDDEERAVFAEFPQYGGVKMEPEPSSESGGCTVAYEVSDPQGRVSEYFVTRLNAHGWDTEVRESRMTVTYPSGEKKGKELTIDAKRNGFIYEVHLDPLRLYTPPRPGTYVVVLVWKNE